MGVDGEAPAGQIGPLSNISRTAQFWAKATGIYGSYKVTQLKALLLKLGGKPNEEIEKLWKEQHQYAGDQMYDLCIMLRGFYLKAGQFIGSRGDFVPEPICRKLTLLCDKVPPMSEARATEAIKRELGITDLREVFEWIDLAKPIGSASIAQVHKAQLRRFSREEVRNTGKVYRKQQLQQHVMRQGEGAWEVCNLHAVSLEELQKLNKGVNLDALSAGQVLSVPQLSTPSHSSSGAGGKQAGGSGVSAAEAVRHAVAHGDAPSDGLVAVKIQYPDALPMMTADLGNIRAAAFYLSKTELKFDLVSAVDELNKQIRLEFDFTREARVMDTIAHHLRGIRQRIEIPRSIPGLVTRRLLVMQFLEGVPLTEAGSKLRDLSQMKRDAAKKRILHRVSEAYGRMILGEGLFQADGHPGNILVAQGARIGLLDYGQSKQLSEQQRKAFARLVLAMHKGNAAKISEVLGELGVVTENADASLRTEMAYGMFDTRGKVDPFDPNTPIKRSAISRFPPDLFFVLRVVQLLRGLAQGMGISDFSSADQWAPFAREALRPQHTAFNPWHFLTAPLKVLPLPAWRNG